MATFSVVDLARLDAGWILAPERYDPRRSSRAQFESSVSGCARVVSDVVDRRKGDPTCRYLVLDTGDAQEGSVRAKRHPVTLDEIGSAKKRVQPGDVIISRLRPYLRQVAFIDSALFTQVVGEVEVVVSTEFFVLRSGEPRSIAFLVALLLSAPAQEILAASQEGGHHPRFNQQTLESIGIPELVLTNRDEISDAVENSVWSYRNADLVLRSLVSNCANAYLG